MKLRPHAFMLALAASASIGMAQQAHASPKPITATIMEDIDAASKNLGPIGKGSLVVVGVLALVLGHNIHAHYALRNPNKKPTDH